MKRNDHTPTRVLMGIALAEAKLPWIPIGFLIGRLAIPPQLVPPAANQDTKP